MEAKLKVEMVVPLKTSKGQNRRQKIIFEKKQMEGRIWEAQLAGFEVQLGTKMGKGLWEGISTQVMARRDFEKGEKITPNAIGLF